MLLVGAPPCPTPVAEPARLTLDIDKPCGLVVLFPGAGINATFESLARQGRLAVPIADLTGGLSPRADFRCETMTIGALNHALAATQPIRDALQRVTLPENPAAYDQMAILLLAASRQTRIEGCWNARTNALISYPLLHGIRDCRSRLEQMTRSGFLTRHFFDRLHVCASCGSARMPVREVCIACGSADLREESLIHHYRCGYQALRSQFEQGQELICPKCNRTLHHYGLDYDAPGAAHQCNHCQELFSEPDIAFICADCGRETRGGEAATQDWFHYELTSDGTRAAMLGQLPSLELESFVSGINAYRTPRDLAIMIDFEDRVHRRYSRPFSIITINFSSSQDMAGVDLLRFESMVWDIIHGALRETDFLAALEHQLVLLLPETEPEGARILVERLRALLAETTSVSSCIQVELLAEEKIPALVDIMRRR